MGEEKNYLKVQGGRGRAWETTELRQSGRSHTDSKLLMWDFGNPLSPGLQRVIEDVGYTERGGQWYGTWQLLSTNSLTGTLQHRRSE